MEVRRAQPSDIPEILPLWIEFMDFHNGLDADYVRANEAAANWTEYIRSKFSDRSAAIFVAQRGEDYMGYIGAQVRPYPPVWTIRHYGFIEEIAVAAAFRRQGVASQLYAAAEDWLRAQGVDRVQVTIDVANAVSQGFFRSHGFSDYTQTLLKKIGQ